MSKEFKPGDKVIIISAVTSNYLSKRGTVVNVKAYSCEVCFDEDIHIFDEVFKTYKTVRVALLPKNNIEHIREAPPLNVEPITDKEMKDFRDEIKMFDARFRLMFKKKDTKE